MKLRFSEQEIGRIAARYEYYGGDGNLIKLRPTIMTRRCLLKQELKQLAQWKSPRSAAHIENNKEEFVKEITGFALSASTERATIEALTLLDGVQWPTASVILHFFHRNPYPILDYRALWSLSLKLPQCYSFGFWWAYVEYCRELSSRNGVDMRTLDKALWQYSKEKQK
jgi:hypothetical protein